MILSMTGFAAASREFPGGLIALELRAVNHRYLDLQLRLPEELRVIEPQLREQIAARVTRGKIECRIGISQAANTAPRMEIDQDVLTGLLDAVAQLKQRAPGIRDLSTGELLRWPGLLSANDIDAESLQHLVLGAVGQLLDDFNATRAREGEKLKAVLIDRLTQIEGIVTRIRPRLPEILAGWRDKLTARLVEAIGSIDDDRLKQEFALFAQKIDVDEELARLSTHVSEVRRILGKGGQVGKRLDFLMQELNREANTLGSKSVSTETTQASVELKVLIEQMREQIQNIE
ncbi:YicC/YloC family endoribonuclease [Microvirgula aerodenitrificans]|uniref:YicC/YloC family endoribonuclease n=1 Tax=Microvirgula aerodenitrificans TaxID=57480 RepID=UPI00248ED6B8|nr:YicC/YloC family endoribonuclease [Microvirgula aerodenitrificans]